MITQSQFKPAFGISHPHLQTLLPTFLRAKNTFNFHHQTLELDDGDFIDLAWSEKPTSGKPIIIVFHGLEGSKNSPYVKGIMTAIKNQGWSSVAMHFRGCSGRPNRLPHSYHSGETGDAKFFICWLKNHYPDSSLAAVGFSLGGNMLLKLQGELGETSPFEATASICAPLMLDNCANRINQGSSRIYQRHLLNSMKNKLLEKSKRHNYEKLINLNTSTINNINSFWQFDDLVTAPLNGFENVHDYYAKSSARQYLQQIKRNTLIIQALDDPFMSEDLIPKEEELSDNVQLEISRFGGHIGFISGSIVKPVFWLEKRIVDFLQLATLR